MRSLRISVFALVYAARIWCGGAVPQPPAYTANAIVNAASYLPGSLAPNTIASIFGTNLCYSTRSVSSSDIKAAVLPTSMGGVTVYVGNVAAGLYYVSPTQINFLVPNVILPGTSPVVVIRESLAGPELSLLFADTAPGLFQDGHNRSIATHADGTLITDANPAHGDEWIVVYCAGLGRTVPDIVSNEIPSTAMQIQQFLELKVLLNGTPVEADRIYYAGVTPGYAGLYQINLKLPGNVGPAPEIRVRIGSQVSAPGISLATQ